MILALSMLTNWEAVCLTVASPPSCRSSHRSAPDEYRPRPRSGHEQRVDLSEGDGVSLPAIGDLALVDQGFTGSDGRAMYMVYCQNPDGSTQWTADLSQDELEPVAGK